MRLGPGAGSGVVQRSLLRAAEQNEFNLKTPFEQYPRKIQNLILYGKNAGNARPASAFPGLIPLLDRWYAESGSEGYREWLGQYMSAIPCPKCQGQRLRPQGLRGTSQRVLAVGAQAHGVDGRRA